jgi:dolichol-phosphate mannosyltransferase
LGDRLRRASWLIGPLADLVAFCAVAAAVALAPAIDQCVSFAAALALAYVPRAARRQVAAGERLGLGWIVRLSVVTALVFFLRGALFSLAADGWGWPATAAIVPAALLSAALLGAGFRYAESAASWRLGSGAAWQAGAIGAIVIAAGLRLLYGARVELLPEETYYWTYARHLDFGYLDHPPMVAWLIAAGRALFGDGEFGVRAGAFFSAVVAAGFMYRVTRRVFGADAALAAVLLLQTLPYFFLTGLLMTPDAPLFAAWAGALCFLERALIGGRARAWWGAGVCFGVGLLAKYTIALLGASTLLFMLMDKPARAWFKRFEPYGAALLAAVIFSPVIVWNAQHEWASFLFQTTRRLADHPQFALPKLIASMLVLLTPTGLAAALLLFTRFPAGGAAADASRTRAWRWLQVSTLAPLAVYALFSLRHEVKLDWTGAAWLGAVPLLAWGLVNPAGRFGARIARAWGPTVILLLLVYGAGLYHLALGIPGLGYGAHAELVPVGWRELARRVQRAAEEAGKPEGVEPLIVGMDRYAIASELSFYAPDRSEALRDTSSGHLFGQVGLMYERWFPPAAERGRMLFLVAWNPRDLDAPGLGAYAERFGRIEEGLLTRGGRLIRPYYYRLAYGYRGPQADGSGNPP